MADAITEFFEDLNRREFEPLLAKTSGTVRFDLHEGPQTTHWLLAIDQGRLRVSQEDHEAGAVFSAEPRLFADLVTGREDGIAAMLRGDLLVSGDLSLAIPVERLFPTPPDTRGPRRVGVRKGA